MYNPFSLEGKRILITGASSGIGQAVAIECSKLGAKVIITGRNKERLDTTYDQLVGNGHIKFIADLMIDSELAELTVNLPDLDGLVNAAGIIKILPFQFVNKEDLTGIFNINLFAPVLLSQKIVRAKKLKRDGSIVFISSIDGPLTVHVGNSIYSATKGAICAISKNMAIDLAPKNIRVNCILPGMVETPLINIDAFNNEQIIADMKLYPLKRYGKPEEIAFATIYLLSDASAWITGSNLIKLLMVDLPYYRTMRQAYLKAITYYLPEEVLSNEELVKEFPEWTIEKVANKVGIDYRHIAANGETAGDMAERAALNLFAEWDIKPNDIDFVMLCTQSPDYFLPTTACILQHRLGIPTNAGAIDYNLGCSGYVYGLALAKGLIVSNIANNILLLTAETYSKHIHPQDKGNRTIFGDAATATIVSTEGFAQIGEFSLGTDGSGAENLIVRTGGMRNKDTLSDIRYDESGTLCSSDHLYMNGTEIFTFTQDNVPLLVADTLAKNGYEQSDIDLFVFHQANKYMLGFLRKKIKIDEDKFYYCLADYGNTVSSTIPIALKEAMSDCSIKIGNKVLLAGFGVGYSWGGVMLFYKN